MASKKLRAGDLLTRQDAALHGWAECWGQPCGLFVCHPGHLLQTGWALSWADLDLNLPSLPLPWKWPTWQETVEAWRTHQALGVDRLQTRPSDGEEAGCNNGGRSLSETCPGAFAGVRENGRAASSVLENTQRGFCDVMWSENEPRHLWSYWIRQMWVWRCLCMCFAYTDCPMPVPICVQIWLRFTESFCPHVARSDITRHKQMEKKKKKNLTITR